MNFFLIGGAGATFSLLLFGIYRFCQRQKDTRRPRAQPISLAPLGPADHFAHPRPPVVQPPPPRSFGNVRTLPQNDGLDQVELDSPRNYQFSKNDDASTGDHGLSPDFHTDCGVDEFAGTNNNQTENSLEADGQGSEECIQSLTGNLDQELDEENSESKSDFESNPNIEAFVDPQQEDHEQSN